MCCLLRKLSFTFTITNIITFRDCRTRPQLFSLTVSTYARVIFLVWNWCLGKKSYNALFISKDLASEKKCLFCVFQARGKKTPKWRLDLKQAQGEGRFTCQSRVAHSSPLILSPLPHSYPLRPFCLRFLFALPSTRDPFHREKIPLKVLVSIGYDTDSFFFLITNALNSSYF